MDRLDKKLFSAFFKNQLAAAKSLQQFLASSCERNCLSILFSVELESIDESFRKNLNKLSYLKHLNIPEIGPVIVAGPLASEMSNWAVSGFQSDLKSVFSELGFSESQARNNLIRIKNGESFFYAICSNDETSLALREIANDAIEFSVDNIRYQQTSHSLFDFNFPEQTPIKESYRPLM